MWAWIFARHANTINPTPRSNNDVAVNPLTYLLVSWLKKREGLDTYDQDIDYNPFRLEVTGNEPH